MFRVTHYPMISKMFSSFSFSVLHLLNQNVIKSKVQCPHSISRTCLAQEFGLVLFQQTLFFMIFKYVLKKEFLYKSLGKYKGIGNRIYLTLSMDSTFAMIKSPWWRCCVCWKSVLDLFWQMFALSAWASYLKWQTVWCHLSNKNLWEFSFCSSFSSTSSIFSLPVSYSAKSGRQQRPRMQCTDRRFKTGFAPDGLALNVQNPLPCCDYVAIRCPEKKRNSQKAK